MLMASVFSDSESPIARPFFTFRLVAVHLAGVFFTFWFGCRAFILGLLYVLLGCRAFSLGILYFWLGCRAFSLGLLYFLVWLPCI